ncbi:hypothetical protein D9M70_635420 [compost metagenome]
MAWAEKSQWPGSSSRVTRGLMAGQSVGAQVLEQARMQCLQVGQGQAMLLRRGTGMAEQVGDLGAPALGDILVHR